MSWWISKQRFEPSATTDAEVSDSFPPDYLKRIAYIWQELQAERENQAAIVASLFAGGAGLLALDGLLIGFSLGLGVPYWSHIVAIVAAITSAGYLGWCLFGGRKRTDEQGRKYRDLALEVMEPANLEPLEGVTSGNTLYQLYLIERSLVQNNLHRVINPKSRVLTTGVVWFLIAVVVIAVGEVQGLSN